MAFTPFLGPRRLHSEFEAEMTAYLELAKRISGEI